MIVYGEFSNMYVCYRFHKSEASDNSDNNVGGYIIMYVFRFGDVSIQEIPELKDFWIHTVPFNYNFIFTRVDTRGATRNL